MAARRPRCRYDLSSRHQLLASQQRLYWWRHFDAAEVAQDFARTCAAGFDTVRLFLYWEDLQPTPERVEEYRELKRSQV